MTFALYPSQQSHALAVPPGPPVFTAFAALSATVAEFRPPYEQMMFIRVAMLDGASAPKLSVAAGTGIPVTASLDPQPVFSSPGQAGYVGDVWLNPIGANVFEVMVGFVTIPAMLSWRLGIRHDGTTERHFTWAVADSPAETAHPWVAPSPVKFEATATVPVQGDPRELGVDDARQLAYIGNFDSSSVSVIDLQRQAVVATVHVAEEPRSVAVDAATHAVYIANLTKAIFAIDPDTHAVTTPAHFDTTTGTMAIDSDRRRLYVAAPSNSISIFDLDEQRVTGTVALPIDVGEIAVDSTLHRVYALGHDADRLCYFDPDSSAVTVLNVPVRGGFMTVDSASHVVYFSRSSDNVVEGIDADGAMLTTIRTGRLPFGMAIDSAAYTLYVANRGDKSLSAIDTRIDAQTAVIPVGDDAGRVRVTKAGRTVITTNSGDGTVSIVQRLGLAPA